LGFMRAIKSNREKGEEDVYNCLNHYRSTRYWETIITPATKNQVMTPWPPPPLPGSLGLFVVPQGTNPESNVGLYNTFLGI
jgi:hypothetical protein